MLAEVSISSSDVSLSVLSSNKSGVPKLQVTDKLNFITSTINEIQAINS